MADYYCKHCGIKNNSVLALTRGSCAYHPNGMNKGKHELYEGSEKAEYTCKYCGIKKRTIMELTRGACRNHPNGINKGKHSPAL